jgi:membrane protease YdiL (CAAX protease family)
MNTMGKQATVLAPSPAPNNNPATPHATRGGGLRGWTARHPVSAFLALAFCIAYPAMSLPLLASHGVIPSGWMPRLAGLDTERIASLLLVFVALLPAALFVTWAAEGRPGVRALVSRMFRWRVGARWWLLILAGLPTLTLAFAVLLGDTLKPVDIAPFVIGQVFGLLVNLLLINLWEETAWTGVVQTRLERRHGLATAALLTAVPFALAHMPLHFIGDFTVESLVTALVSLLIVCAIVRLMIGVFLRGTRDSILAVALLHTVFNRSNNEEGLVASLVEGDARKLGGLLAVLVLTAVVALVARRKLGRPYRLMLDSAAATSSTTSTSTDRNQT